MKAAAPATVDAAASRSGSKFFCHLVNKERRSPCKLEFTVDGKRMEKFTAWEIAADPELEISELCPDALNPKRLTVEDGVYTLPGAAVAVVEGDF